jgi:hypothetical protein
MESSVKRTQRDDTLAFRLAVAVAVAVAVVVVVVVVVVAVVVAVVEQVEKSELTYKGAQQRYGIQGRSTVLMWLRKHGRQGWSSAASSEAMALTRPKDRSRPSSTSRRCMCSSTRRRRRPGCLKPLPMCCARTTGCAS